MFRNPTADLLVVLLIVLLIFGPKRLPSLGRQLGQGLREFKDSITGDSKDEDEGERPEITQTAGQPVAGAAETNRPAAAAGAGGVGTDPGAAAPPRESAEIGSERRS